MREGLLWAHGQVARYFSRSKSLKACLLTAVTGSNAQQDPFPSKTIRIVVGFAAGGGNDLIARIIADRNCGHRLAKSVVVENKVGGGGRVAAEYLMTQPPDGYTLMLGASGAMSVSPAISEKLPYATH